MRVPVPIDNPWPTASRGESGSVHGSSVAVAAGSPARTTRTEPGSLLLSVAALVSAATRRNELPLPPMPANAIVGHVLIDGRGADGVTITLDGRAATATTGGGAFWFRDVETGIHTIAIRNYPAGARFDRTSATVSIDTEGRAATVNFSGSYIHRPRIARPVVVAEATGKHSTLFALRDAAGHAAIEM